MWARSVGVIWLVLALLLVPLGRARAESDDYVLPSTAQLAASDQALGWWLGGAGLAGLLSGVFLIGASRAGNDPNTEQLQLGAGGALSLLGGALLSIGMVVMSSGAPGPCEMHGTAHDGLEVSLSVSPTGAGLSGRF